MTQPPTPLPAGRADDDAAVDLGVVGGMLFHTLRRAQAAVQGDLHAGFAAEETRGQAFAVLSVMRRNPGLRQSRLGLALEIHRANLVPLLDTLEQRGLAERRAVPGDRRARGLFLTAQGDAVLTRLEEVAAAHEARLAARLGVNGRSQLLGLLHRLSDPAFDPA